MANLPILDQTIFATIKSSEAKIERNLNCDLLYFHGEIRFWAINHFRSSIESLSNIETSMRH